MLPDAEQIAYLDVDDTIRATYGYAKQGAGYGYSGVKGLNALIAALSTPGSGAGDRGDPAAQGLGELRARRCPAGRRRPEDQPRLRARSGLLVVRADSAFYGRDVVAAIRRAKARFSITARQDVAVKRAIAAISEDAWTTIRYPHAVFDEQLGQWVSDAQVAEVPFTAFASRGKKHAVTARLIVRRVRDQNPDHLVANAQGELFPAWRHHAVFTDSPLVMLQAEADHRRHAIIEQVIADLKGGPLAHLPSGTVQRQRRLAGPGRDGVQPHPRRRRARLPLPRPSHHRHDPPPADQRPRPTGPLRPPHPPAATDQLALGRRLARPVHRRTRTTHRSHRLTTGPTATTDDQWNSRADRRPRSRLRAC